MNKKQSTLLSIFTMLGMLLLSSCFGKWDVEIKNTCSGDGSMRIDYKLFPLDETAKKRFQDIKSSVKEDHPDATVEEREDKGLIYLFVSMNIPEEKNEKLKKVGNDWVYMEKNESDKSFHIKKFEVIMPGWITETNATTSYLNQATWEGENLPETFQAKSLAIPISFMIGVPAVFITLLLLVLVFARRKTKFLK